MTKKRREKTSSYFDYNLLFLIVFALCFGMVMLYSSSSYTSANKYGDGTHYLKLQIRNILIGIIPMAFFTAVDYRRWKNFAGLAYVGSFVLCALVMVPQFSSSSHGSSRWLNIGGIVFQPSEVAKLGMIIFIAALLERVGKKIDNLKTLGTVVLIVLPIFGIVAYSNLSTAIIIFGIVGCMLFVASSKYSHFLLLAGLGIGLIVIFIMAEGYRGGRVTAWLHPEEAGDAGYQTLQGLYAIGSGGLFGKGLGQSLQKMGNVPESQNDMIFTIICEELGLFGAILVILLFLMIIWRMMIIANNARDLFGSLIVAGIMAHIALQAILNIAVVTNTIPNTGVILPFISYGGTSLIFLMGEMGLALSVSRGIRLEKIE